MRRREGYSIVHRIRSIIGEVMAANDPHTRTMPSCRSDHQVAITGCRSDLQIAIVRF